MKQDVEWEAGSTNSEIHISNALVQTYIYQMPNVKNFNVMIFVVN